MFLSTSQYTPARTKTALSVPVFGNTIRLWLLPQGGVRQNKFTREFVMGRLITLIVKFMGKENSAENHITEQERGEADQFTSMLACFMNDEQYLRYRR